MTDLQTICATIVVVVTVVALCLMIKAFLEMEG